MSNLMYGSAVNRFEEGAQIGELEVGMGATEMLYSDRHPWTVQKIISDKRVVVTRDKAKRVDRNGMSDCQEYSYESTPLIEGVTDMHCRHPLCAHFEDGQLECGRRDADGTCRNCKFWKRHKPTNGKVLVKTKRGWKELGGETYFTLGIREEYYDYSF